MAPRLKHLRARFGAIPAWIKRGMTAFLVAGNWKEGRPMKWNKQIMWIAVIGLAFMAADVFAEDQLVLRTRADKDNYATGVDIVRKLKKQGGEINLDIVIQGMRDEIIGETHLMNEVDLNDAILALESKSGLKNTALKNPSSVPAPAIEKEPGLKTADPEQKAMMASQNSPKPGCGIIEFDGHREMVCSNVATIMPAALQTTGQGQAQEQPVPEHSFAALAQQQQQQFNSDGEVLIVLSDLSRRHGETWLKTQSYR